jgi:WD40 repeat protein
MAFSPDGRFFAIDVGGRVRLVDPDTGREVTTLDPGTGSLGGFSCLAISPDGTQVAAGRDHIIHLWDLRRIREELARLGLDWASPPYPAPAERLRLEPVVLVPPVDDHVKNRPIAQAPAELRPPALNSAAATTPEAWKRP